MNKVNLVNVGEHVKFAIFTTQMHETKRPGERGERCREVFLVSRTSVAKVAEEEGWPIVNPGPAWGYTQLPSGISPEILGISFGDQIQDVGIVRGYPRAKSQDVGITVFLTSLGGPSLRPSLRSPRLISEKSRKSSEIRSRFF